MTHEEILAKHCPKGPHNKDAWTGNCPDCIAWKPAIIEAKREGLRMALRLIEKNPLAADEVIKTLLEGKVPE